MKTNIVELWGMSPKNTYIIAKGSRKGCYCVNEIVSAVRGEIKDVSCRFLLDEPGAWFEDKWNCHVDGTDYEFETKEAALRWGFKVEGIDPDGVHVYEPLEL